MLGFVLLAALTACESTPATPSAAAPARPLPDRWYGVTVDDITHIDDVSASLAALPRMPVTRMLFDPGEQPADYARAVSALRPVSYLLGTPVDSSEVENYSVPQYVDRFRRYVRAFGRQVDVWEIGNEVNGEWLGATADVVAKIVGAHEVVRAAGGRTALTLYDNIGCSPDPGHDMLTWARTALPVSLRTDLDYVLVSYYEHDCAGIRPSTGEWSGLFERLHALFPRAKLGFGEVGTDPHATTAAKLSYLTHYYTLPRFGAYDVGGYFWWYYAEDMLPHRGNPLWQRLAALMR
jgi:hypothetical protein